MRQIKLCGFIFFTILISSTTKAQHFILLGGGYSFASIEDTSANASGFKINMEYEYLTWKKQLAVGFQVAYHQVKTEKSSTGRNIKFKAVPFAGYLKYYIGKDKLRGYVKGLFGLQSSRYEFEGPNASTQSWDIGLIAGGGIGGALKLNDKLRLLLDYELDWYNNSYYRELTANTISLGLQLQID